MGEGQVEFATLSPQENEESSSLESRVSSVCLKGKKVFLGYCDLFKHSVEVAII